MRKTFHWSRLDIRWLSSDGMSGPGHVAKTAIQASTAPNAGSGEVACDGPGLSLGGGSLRSKDKRNLVWMFGLTVPAPLMVAHLLSHNSPPLADIAEVSAVITVLLAVAHLVRQAMRVKTLERQIDAGEGRWLTLLDCAPFPILKCGSQGTIEYVNPATIRAVGCHNRDLIGRDVASLIDPADQSDVGQDAELPTEACPLRSIAWSSIELCMPDGGPPEALWIGRSTVEQVAAESARDVAIQELSEFKQAVEDQNRLLEMERDGTVQSTDILGQSDAIRYVLHKIGQVASTSATVLIEGETGVGKELVAQTIHENSARRNRPLVRVNCAALPPSLIESELFGHEKGAYTGADRMRQGRFELAEGGTIFLDEIGELGLDVQAKLLRVLQEGEYTRVGGTHTLRANVRVIAATNVDLKKAVESRRFRKDLYFRLQVFPITVPPLRERREDIPALTQHFVTQFCRRHGRPELDIRMAVVNRLTAYGWPGNVRELANVLECAVITSSGTCLTLPKQFAVDLENTSPSLSSPTLSLAEMERHYIKQVLVRVNGQIAGAGGAAEILGLHPNTLRGRMAKLGVTRVGSESKEELS